ncbi:uncharacterized protein LOC119639033 [Glossina fuscipes]|uniref:Uncharacterized protein LOC119639033 n=1 Tax=Glossina fuscipes TaxID=7396 RepID=A0A9C5Z901_9MUSC|nr:uncharacterized protein LOC119639033 [Glossina fuscipes]
MKKLMKNLKCIKIIKLKCDPDDPFVCLGKELLPTERYARPEEKGMWKYPICCGRVCRDQPPRLDEFYYQMSDKKRNYPQTWVSCPPITTIDIKVCPEHHQIKPMPTRPTRTKEEIHGKKGVDNQMCKKTACKLSNRHRWLLPCKGLYPKQLQQQRAECCFKAEGCASPRIPPNCRITSSLSDCKKERTPYPSYSECQKVCKWEVPIDPHCDTMYQAEMCEVWAEYRRRLALAGGKSSLHL